MTLDIDFDSASLDLSSSRIEGARVLLRGHDNHYPGKWKWVHFRLRGCRGREVWFELPDTFEPGSDHLERHRMVYSYDGHTWAFFPHNRRQPARGIYEFTLGAPFDRDEVFVAYGIPYPASRVDRMVESMASSPFVQPTRSADESFVLGMTPGGSDAFGRRVPPLPLYGLRIGEGGPDARRIVLMSGVHPNETPASHMMEGMMAFLIDPDHPDAQFVRSHAEVLIYPMVNPEGRFAGYNRGTREYPERDANRFWHPDLYGDFLEVRTIAESLKQDLDGPPDYFIDLHSWTDTGRHFGILSREDGFHLDPFWQAFRRIEPRVNEEPSNWLNWSTETFAFKILGARFAMTFETMFVPNMNIDGFHELGRNLGRALAAGLSARA